MGNISGVMDERLNVHKRDTIERFFIIYQNRNKKSFFGGKQIPN
jgi:hypothetical protein